MSDFDSIYELRKKYSRFRILVIGRANAGKTTLLQRVCNTTEDPCIYDQNDQNLLEPTSARGIHDIHRPFAFRSNPGFIFHDSPGFETGDESQLQEVFSFMEKKARSTEVDDQLHAIWFCFVLNKSRPLLPLEIVFFETARAGNVPVIAIFTKFDDLMIQIYDMDLDDDENRQIAEEEVERKFRKPLSGYASPPRADVCFEALHTTEIGQHQDQVKVLIEKTASSLDDTALKMLFVSVQQNNIGLCIQYAISDLATRCGDMDTKKMALQTMWWFGHSFLSRYNYGETEGRRFDRRRFDLNRDGNADSVRDLLNANFASDSSAFSTTSHSKRKSSLSMFTAILICLENSFWNQDAGDNFVDSFKKSFTLYIESGIRKMAEADIDVFAKEQAGRRVDAKFKKKLHKIIMDHRLPHPKARDAA